MSTIEFFDHEGLGGSLSKIGSMSFSTFNGAKNFAAAYTKAVNCKVYWGGVYKDKIIRIEIIGS